MNGLRRALLATYSVAFIALCLGLITLAWNQDQQLDINPEGFRFVAYISSGDSEKLAFSALMACLALFGVLTLVVSIAVGEGKRGTVRVRRPEGGTAEVTTDWLEDALRADLQAVPELRQVDPRVRAHGGGIEVDIAAAIEPSASISHVTDVVMRTTTVVLRDELGIANLRRPHVRLRYDEVAARPISAVRTAPRSAVEDAWPPPPPDIYPQAQPERGFEPDPWPAPPPDLPLRSSEAFAPPQQPPAAPYAPPPPAGPRWDGPEPDEEVPQSRE